MQRFAVWHEKGLILVAVGLFFGGGLVLVLGGAVSAPAWAPVHRIEYSLQQPQLSGRPESEIKPHYWWGRNTDQEVLKISLDGSEWGAVVPTRFALGFSTTGTPLVGNFWATVGGIRVDKRNGIPLAEEHRLLQVQVRAAAGQASDDTVLEVWIGGRLWRAFGWPPGQLRAVWNMSRLVPAEENLALRLVAGETESPLVNVVGEVTLRRRVAYVPPK